MSGPETQIDFAGEGQQQYTQAMDIERDDGDRTHLEVP
jgi:hypothetical protein